MRFIKGLFKWGLIGFCALLLLALFVGNEPKSRHAATSNAPSAPTAATVVAPPAKSSSAPIKMSAGAVEEAVEENEISLQNRISAAGGLLVTGRVQSVEAVWGKPVIHLRGRNEFLSVSAFMSSGDKERAGNLRKGESVAVLCQTAKKMMGAALYDCRFN